jgi:acyl-CoA reductase-like NAD-dependent aldehyde dehydrogenase
MFRGQRAAPSVTTPPESPDANCTTETSTTSCSMRSRSEMAANAVADRLRAESAALARLTSAESGLCLKDTVHEVGRAVDVFRFAAMEALRDDGETFAGDVSDRGRDRRAHTLRVPVALVAGITPFNHPLNQVAHSHQALHAAVGVMRDVRI